MLDNTINIDFADAKWQMYWPRNDNETLKVILKDWQDHTPIIFDKLSQKRTVIQAGGHCGLYARLYSSNFARVFTFEPELINFTHLAANCKDTRIVKINAALGDENKFVSMGIVSYQNTGMHKVLPDSVSGIIAYSVTLDSIKPPDVDLIHLDVEGYEYKAIKGAVKTISKYKPVVVLEMSNDIDKIYSIMKKLVYKEIHKTSGASVNSIFVYDNA